MKKYYIYIAAIIFAGFMTACNDNIDDDLPGIKDKERPTDTKQRKYTVSEADYALISKGLRATKIKEDSLLADAISKNKVFSKALDPHMLIPYLLTDLLKSPDFGASFNVTFNYDHGRDTVVSYLSTPLYTLNAADYAKVWGTPPVEAFTPAKAPETYIPNILKEKFGVEPKGRYRNVSYYYSEEEPVTSTVETKFLFENMENNPSGAGTGKPMDVAGWINKDISGSIFWQVRTLSSTNNNYSQVSSYKSGTVNDVWLISKQVDLTGIDNPHFTFDIVIGNYNASCLKILISKDFDGNKANINAATWDDVTSKFVLPIPASGYTPWASAGDMALTDYANKKIYIAFRYEGDDLNTPKKTTTYQIDNVKVYEQIIGQNVESKFIRNSTYESDGSKWKSLTLKNLNVLQPEDYQKMDLTYLTTTEAPKYLPKYLEMKYPYAQNGESQRVVYQTKASDCYADEYIYTDGVWVLNKFIETQSGQFIFATTGKWIFDPTIVLSLGKDDYMTVVNYIKAKDPSLIDSKGTTESYYGFNGGYSNITFRESDRVKDPSYPIKGTDAEKLAFCKKRTVEGLGILLSANYPDVQPNVGGIDQLAEITLTIYYGPSRYDAEEFVYTLQCTGNKEWKFVKRISSKTGVVEKAE